MFYSLDCFSHLLFLTSSFPLPLLLLSPLSLSTPFYTLKRNSQCTLLQFLFLFPSFIVFSLPLFSLFLSFLHFHQSFPSFILVIPSNHHHPYLYLFLAAGEPQLATAFFNMVRGWVVELRSLVHTTQEVNKASMNQVCITWRLDVERDAILCVALWCGVVCCVVLCCVVLCRDQLTIFLSLLSKTRY